MSVRDPKETRLAPVTQFVFDPGAPQATPLFAYLSGTEWKRPEGMLTSLP